MTETTTNGLEQRYTELRLEMVREQIAGRGVSDPRVLEALRKVKRHLFVPATYQARAYEDHPLPIGEDQTISQPFIVAFMTELAGVKPDDRVLEIGTGSGYQAAVLAELAREVYSIEIVEVLGLRAEKLLQELGYQKVFCKIGDGYQGWPEHQPFDAILVTAAPDHVPQPLIDQLADGGRLVIPVGADYQELLLITRAGDRLRRETKLPVRFVPMTGEAEKD